MTRKRATIPLTPVGVKPLRAPATLRGRTRQGQDEPGLNIEGRRRSNNVEVRPPSANPFRRIVNIETSSRRGPVPGTRTGVAVGRRSQTR